MTVVYKICDKEEWAAASQAGRYRGSADDRRDGFIHLSTAGQVAGTLAKHFAGRRDLLLIAFEAADLGDGLRWETSRGGDRFPHLYGDLLPERARSVVPLDLGGDGRHLLPADLA